MIELLYWEGCPSYPQALEELRAALSELGHGDVEIRMRSVDTEEEAARERFVGSPTIRVNGRDPFPPPPDEPASLSCRVYRLPDGRFSPTPDPKLLRRALAETLASAAT